MQFDTFPQSHAGAIKHYPSIGRGDTEFLTNLLVGAFMYFAQQENRGQLFGHAIHAILQHKHGDAMAAQHDLMDCLAETVWRAQRDRQPPDAEAYLQCMRQKAGPA